LNSGFVVVIPARGGSKRVPRKNIRSLAGRPLIAYTIETARRAGFDDLIYVSTEDSEIAEIVRAEGAKVIDRPVALAEDSSPTEEALLHALGLITAGGSHAEWVVTLAPTSPFRSADTLRFFISATENCDVDALISLTESRGDYWRCGETGELVRLFPGAPRRQQDREALYEENSAVYVTKAEALRSTRSVLGASRRGVVIDALEGFDINNEYDLAVAEALLSRDVKAGQGPPFVVCC
jgi:CMP-N,N'-diacetyllegionaminic acid synthase